VNEVHPIDFYAGVSLDGARILMLVALTEPPDLSSYQAFDIRKALRPDGRWTLSVELKLGEFASIFAHLCDDLIGAAEKDCQPRDAGAYVVGRIVRWQKLLGRDYSEILNQQEIRGLIGELLFLEKIACVAKGQEYAVQAWEGPLDAPQDFRFPDRFIEVKTCGISSPLVWVSSAEQLDAAAVPIILAVAVIQTGDTALEESFTLASLVARLRASIEAAPLASASFEQKLKIIGYVDRPEYTKDCFALQKFRYFEIGQDFPKIARRTLPKAIVSLKYQVELSGCRAFERDSAGL
jgi:hypothetical protein